MIETKHVFMTFAKAPYYPDHLLIAPKRHIEHILDLSKDEIEEIAAIQKTGAGLLKALGHANVSIRVKEGDDKDKTIAHIHYHLIPDVILGCNDFNDIEREVLENDKVEELMTRVRMAASSLDPELRLTTV